MTINELINEIKKYNDIDVTKKSWVKVDSFDFSNDYIELLSIESSNKHGTNSMIKQWSIIIDLKKDLKLINNFNKLLINEEFKVALTPVRPNSKFSGKWGIRFYDMKKDPNNEIVYIILKYIFNN